MSGDGRRDELELKARVDDPAALEAALRRAGATPLFRGAMIDRRYDGRAGAAAAREGPLAARDEVLRLRIFRPDEPGRAPYGVLGWKGAAAVRDGYKLREEWETPVADPEAALVILERLGYEVVLRIDRTIVEYALGEARVRIEWYPAMDVLVEVEGPPAAIERAVGVTGLPRASFVPDALPAFVAAYEGRTGRRARLAERREGRAS